MGGRWESAFKQMTRVRPLFSCLMERYLNESNRQITLIESTPRGGTIGSTQTQNPQQGAALMKHTTKYVALDVHQEATATTVRGHNGVGDGPERIAHRGGDSSGVLSGHTRVDPSDLNRPGSTGDLVP